MLRFKQQHLQYLLQNFIFQLQIYQLKIMQMYCNNANVLQQLKSGFKCTITWNKYQSKTATQNAPNQYLDYLIDPSFQKVNRLFVLAFNANDNRIGHSRDYLLNAKIEDYNVMIDE